MTLLTSGGCTKSGVGIGDFDEAPQPLLYPTYVGLSDRVSLLDESTANSTKSKIQRSNRRHSKLFAPFEHLTGRHPFMNHD
jgi:hypothetical protein